jgi:hypothetical protein
MDYRLARDLVRQLLMNQDDDLGVLRQSGKVAHSYNPLCAVAKPLILVALPSGEGSGACKH